MSAPVTFLSLSLFLLTCSLPSAILSGSYSLFWNRSHSALSRSTSGTESVRDRAQILYRAGGRLSLGTLSDRLDSGLLGLSCAAVVIGRFHETIRKREWKELTQRIKIMPYTKKLLSPVTSFPCSWLIEKHREKCAHYPDWVQTGLRGRLLSSPLFFFFRVLANGYQTRTTGSLKTTWVIFSNKRQFVGRTRQQTCEASTRSSCRSSGKAFNRPGFLPGVKKLTCRLLATAQTSKVHRRLCANAYVWSTSTMIWKKQLPCSWAW